MDRGDSAPGSEADCMISEGPFQLYFSMILLLLSFSFFLFFIFHLVLPLFFLEDSLEIWDVFLQARLKGQYCLIF